MKKWCAILAIVAVWVMYVALTNGSEKPVPVPPSVQQEGDPAKGYNYLVTGDYIKSGIPYKMFIRAVGKDTLNHLGRTGDNTNLSYAYTAVDAANGERIVAVNCLQCHAQVFDKNLVIGLGNSEMDFTRNQKFSSSDAAMLYNLLSITNKKQFQASKQFLRAAKTIGPKLFTQVRGVNVASRLAALLVAHRDPQTLEWNDKPIMDIPNEVIPSDVPAWWLLKKKNAMFYTGFGRGDFSKFLMASNLLTVSDTTEAAEVYAHFADVLAYLKTLEAPKFPGNINQQLAAQGQKLFNDNCSKCHGTYGENETYPNLLIPASIIRTDTAFFAANYANPQFVQWFNSSWFTSGATPAQLVPYRGYIAPPLDGVWITAPYFHNGSVPTLEGVLNSKARPKYWSRNFEKQEYNYNNPGWKYTRHDKAGKNMYNTTLNGYGNQGHYFGDKLQENERKAVIEYLKTL
ncbi:c-type cytochrome [Aridibaculum aurantiacum]|uniref:c-type cytochrome n=1 Tax=Aridibaculum aurantiacum TaxID=2810307 RepID=UPI001A97CCE9|nr:c-type cytochrome [Aridibaculum aurantiacum]